jgi:hypothetical protein
MTSTASTTTATGSAVSTDEAKLQGRTRGEGQCFQSRVEQQLRAARRTSARQQSWSRCVQRRRSLFDLQPLRSELTWGWPQLRGAFDRTYQSLRAK